MIPILDKLRRSGGSIVVLDGKVRIEAPPGTLSDPDRQVLADHREDLLRLFAGGPGPAAKPAVEVFVVEAAGPAVGVDQVALFRVLDRIDQGGGTAIVEPGQVRFSIRPGVLDDQDRRVLDQTAPVVVRMFGAVTTAEPVVVDQADQGRGQDQEPDLDQWLAENTVEVVSCDQCGGLERWQSIAGSWHCASCDPPVTAQRLRRRAAELRKRYSSALARSGPGPIMKSGAGSGSRPGPALTTTQPE